MSLRRRRAPGGATASRVDTWILLEYRGLWAHDAVDGSTLAARGEERTSAAERSVFPHARILFVRRTERRRADGLVGYVARTTEHASASCAASSSSATTTCSISTSRSAGTPVHHPALPRLHARQARPLLLEVRPPALRGHTRAGRGGLGVAVDARRRRPLRRQPRLAPRRRLLRPGRAGRSRGPCSRRRCAGRSTCRTTAAARVIRSPAQAAERAVREAAGLLGVDDTSVISVEPTEAGLARRRTRCGGGLRGGGAARGRLADAPHLLDRAAQAPEAVCRRTARRRKPSRTSLLTSTRRLSSSSEPGSSAGPEGILRRHEELQLCCEPLRERAARDPRTQASSRRGRRSPCPAARAPVSRPSESSARSSESWPSRIGRLRAHQAARARERRLHRESSAGSVGRLVRRSIGAPEVDVVGAARRAQRVPRRATCGR